MIYFATKIVKIIAGIENTIISVRVFANAFSRDFPRSLEKIGSSAPGINPIIVAAEPTNPRAAP